MPQNKINHTLYKMKNKLNIYITQVYKQISSEFVKLMDLIDVQCIVHIDKLNFDHISKTHKKEHHLIIYPYDKLIQFDSAICDDECFFIYLLEHYDIDNNILRTLISQSIHTFYVNKYTKNSDDSTIELYSNQMTYLPIPIHEISEKYEHDITYYGTVTDRITLIMTELSFQFNINIIDTNIVQIYENDDINIDTVLSNTQILLLLNDDNQMISEYVLSQAMRYNVHIIIERNSTYITNSDFLRQYRNNIHFINEITPDTIDFAIRYLSNFIITKSNINNFLFLNKLTPFFDIQINFTNIYEFAIYYQYNDIYKCINDIKHDKKIFHRFNCYNCISSIQNIQLEDFDTESKYESVLIEFRQFPHIEFIIRNAIFKLGKTWNHTIVCGNYNYDFIKKLVDNIDSNLTSKINIIKINTSFVTRKFYCSLLMSKDFWELFKGEKLLLYQEDTCIFKTNIDDFIMYDYIGAPWPKNQKDNSLQVGNGGFSLRTRQIMIDVIEQVEPSNLELSSNTMNYIKRSQLNCIPEDVYFSKSMIDYNIGTVSTWDEARKFSQEIIESTDPFGGHCFWGANDKQKIITLMTLIEHNNYKDNHMLTSIVNNFHSKNMISDVLNTHKVILINNIYKYFSYESVIPVYTQWIGILTCFDGLPNDMINNLMNQMIFIESIINCAGIIVYHSDIQPYFMKKLQNGYKKINIPVKYIKLPCIIQDIPFDCNVINDSTKLCCIGCNTEDINTFCTMKLEHPFDKSIEYINNENLINVTDYNTNKAAQYDIDIIINNDNYEFIQSLHRSIVFMNVNECTHTNKIVLFIENNVPFFINKTDSSHEYLGDEYPLYYNNIDDLQDILNRYSDLSDLLQKGHEYLLHMDKNDLSFEHFNSEVLKLIN